LSVASRLHKVRREGEQAMNLKALITTLVLGSSSVASVAVAHPVNAPIDAPVNAPIVRDHRAPAAEDCGPVHTRPAPIYQPASHRSRWVTLGSVDDVVDGAVSFRVGRFSRGGQQFRALKLSSEAGKSLIQRVLIRFANGRTQVVEVNEYLNASNPSITIDLDGRARSIAKVTVIGRNARQSAYRVLAI
jgi:hypothetical protein